MTESKEIALQIGNYSYDYPSNWGGKPTRVVHDITLSVDQGESFGFLGQSGSGKTTTIKSILGLTKPATGSIKIFGHAPSTKEARNLIGYVPEQPYFYDHLTVTEILKQYAALSDIPRSEIKIKTEEALQKTGIAHKAHLKLRALSKGLMQRVAMAQAIVHSPKILILDEPFSGLDPLGRREFKDLLFDLKNAGTTIFISSHILEDIEHLCDRASILVDGTVKDTIDLSQLERYVDRHYELVLDEPLPDNFDLTQLGGSIEAHGNSVAFKFDSRDEAERALSLAIGKEADISRYQAAHGNLEDLFIKLIGESTS